MRFLPAARPSGPLPDLSPAEASLREGLRADVAALAEGIGERHLGLPAALARAAEFVEARLVEAGLRPVREPFEVAGHSCRNLVADLGPAGPQLLVSAHYDSVPGSPGADDNATGVAALLALAANLAARDPAPPVRLAAFVNEEPPYFQSEAMGSVVHARACRDGGIPLTGALALDGLGYYSDRTGSQDYPLSPPPALPDTGDFLGLVANDASAGLLEALLGAFQRASGLPALGAVLPEWTPGSGWSDHWSFWQQGWPGVMATDTLPFRHPDYHGPGDTPEKLDFDRLTRAVTGLIAAVDEVARGRR